MAVRSRLDALYLYAAALLGSLGVVSCSGNAVNATPNAISAQDSQRPDASSSSKFIKHVVLIVQENRSFDDFFATFPGAYGATHGKMKTASGGDMEVPLKEVALVDPCDFAHGYHGFLKDLDGGKMDGFAQAPGACHGPKAAYQYVNPQQIQPYWDIATQYVLADQMFQTQGSGSFTAHQDLIAGATIINSKKTVSLVDDPTLTPWGCDSYAGTKTSLLKAIGSTLDYEKNAGPFPCLTYYQTMRDLLDAKGVSWTYYSPPVIGGSGAEWNAFDAIKAVRYSSEWGVNVTDSDTQIFNDISNKKLPAVSWVIPEAPYSDHPATKCKCDTGPSWVASLVNAIGQSSYWKNTAIIILWDDWGGFYDNAKPPFTDRWGGLGFRVPMVVVSPYARETSASQTGYISHTQYEFGSVLKFIEETFGLGSLGTTDERATSIMDCFDFKQTVRKFHSIPSSYSKSYYMHLPPSYEPVDTE